MFEIRNTRISFLYLAQGVLSSKKIQTSDKKLGSGWIKPQPGFVLFLEILCFFVLFFFAVHVFKKKKMVRVVGGCCLTNRIFYFFNLTRPLTGKCAAQNEQKIAILVYGQ